MKFQTLHFIEPMTEDQRNELKSLRQQALEITPFPSNPLSPLTPEEDTTHTEINEMMFAIVKNNKTLFDGKKTFA